MKSKLILLLVFILILLGVYVSQKVYKNHALSFKPTLTWKTYTNIRDGISYERPEDYTNRPYFVVQKIYLGTSTPTALSYASHLWKLNEKDSTGNFPNQHTSSLSTTTIDGKIGYTFVIKDGGFEWEYGGKVLPVGNTRFIIIPNERGDLFQIEFSEDDPKALKMFSTLHISTNLIAPKILPADWQTYTDKDFSFSYPANIFTFDPKNGASFMGLRGSISAGISDQQFDPNHVWGGYDEVKTDKVIVGNKRGYGFFWGDAGAIAYRIYVPLGTTTLFISFNSAGGDVGEDIYPIATDKDLQAQILKTFTFTPGQE